MIIPMITDLHYGARNGNLHFQKNMNLFINQTVVPLLNKHNLKELYVLGDFTDSRKSTNYAIVKDIRENFFDVMKDNGIFVHMIGGNHDMFYRDSNDVASFDVLFGHYDNVHVVTQPVEFEDILMLPWINKNNEDMIRDAILATSCKYCMGHFEIEGAKMYSNSRAEHGMSSKILEKFDLVFSGHFHHRSQYGNIQYIGAAGYYNWQDYGDFRGLTLFNSDKNVQKTIKNPYCLFQHIVYDDSNDEIDYRKVDLSALKNKYVDLIIVSRNDDVLYNDFLSQVHESGYIELKITDNTLKEKVNNIDESVDIETKEVIQLVNDYVDENLDDPEIMKTLIKEIHHEALV